MLPVLPSHFVASDLLLAFIWIGIFYLLCQAIRSKHKPLPCYKFFLPGFFVKIAGTIGFCTVYVYYYKDGDAIEFFYSCRLLADLLFTHPATFFRILFLNDISIGSLTQFDNHYLLPININDHFTFFFIRLITPIYLLSFGNFITCSVILATLCYSGIWKLYLVFCGRFPALTSQMAVAVLFIPSVVFWSSGLLKDTVTLAALGWFVYALHKMLYSKKILPSCIYLIVSSFLLISIKPYILYSLLAASSAWLAVFYLKKLRSTPERFFYAPVVITVFMIVALLLILQVGKNQERFSVQKTADEFIALQVDSQAQSTFYRTPSEGSFSGMLKNGPSNIVLALFRPYVWEAHGLIPLMASVETLLLLLFFLWSLIRLRFIFAFRFLFQDPFLIFSFCFILTLSFIVGFSTNNFGTLDRFRIPLMPFYLALCFVLNSRSIPAMASRGHIQEV